MQYFKQTKDIHCNAVLQANKKQYPLQPVQYFKQAKISTAMQYFKQAKDLDFISLCVMEKQLVCFSHGQCIQ